MSGRSNTIKDIRSRIKHENASLGSGTASSSFSSARSQIPHVGDIFGQHPGSVSIGANAPSTNNSGAVGADPSYAGHAPSDSVSSNYQGRPGHAYSASTSHQYSPQKQAGSIYAHAEPITPGAASFALDPALSMPGSNAGSSSSHGRTPSGPEAGDPPHSPLRPARSMRRPQQAPEITKGLAGMSSSSTAHDRARVAPLRPQLQIPPVGSNSRPATGPSSPSSHAAGRDLLAASRSQGGAHARNLSAQSSGAASAGWHGGQPSERHARAAQLVRQDSRAGTPSSLPDSDDDIFDGLSPVDAPSEGHGAALYSNRPTTFNQLSVPGQRPQRDPRRRSGAPLGSLTDSQQPSALNSVLSALTTAGRKGQANRIMRGTTAEEESSRRRSEKKISESSQQVRKPLSSYVDRSDPRAFQSINAVLRKVETEWPFLAHDRFNSVALALSMLDHSTLGTSRHEFEQVKQIIQTSLQGTIDGHYESFATAITLHNNVSQALNGAQTSVGGARRRLRDSREALGAKRADLVQMWQRSQALKEALKLLDLVEHLRSIPDKLESLMAEKRFLESVNLLVRSLKTIDKPEVVEVGATNDLRAYLKGQEQAMLEILIEELHNHLYLKSYFCDARWKVYVGGQEQLPAVVFGSTYAGVTGTAHDASSPTADRTTGSVGTAGAPTESLQLNLFLQSLRSRPTFDPNLAADIPTSALMTSTKSFSALTGELRSGGTYDASMSSGASSDPMGLRTVGRYGADFDQNPEADSFLYIEMLLESLARLGKLGTALDIVSQRLAIEIHQLVDTTIDEVDARNEPLRRFSVALRPESVLLASSSALARSFTDSMRTSRSSFNVSKRPMSTMLRVSAGETSALQRDGETLRDLFWTLFSKLDAVLQGHRVLYEVAGMIASRAGFKDEVASKKLSGVGALLQVWRPIQQEVRTLLHDYLMEDVGGKSARHAVVSVNDVLRDHKFGRDRNKQLFKLADAGVKPVLGRREAGPLQRHQLAVTQALKASVPGLVSSVDAAGGLNAARPGNHIIVASSSAAPSSSGALVTTTGTTTGRGGRGVDSFTGAGHRLLVKPDAFNVSVLFQPALAFVERVSAVMPSEAAGETSGGFSAFLDEFVQDVFLPQLEEKVHTLFAGATSHSDSFVEDPASRQLGMTANSRPVVKSASNVIALIDSLYSMLRTTSFHRESYSRLIVTTIIQYYQKCSERFRDLVSGGDGDVGSDLSGERRIALSASWAQKPELVACLAELRDSETSPQRKWELMAQETRFELAYTKARPPLAIHELITSRKKLLALACLQHSVEWFTSNINRLKPAVEPTDDNLSQQPTSTDCPSLVDSSTLEGDSASALPLPLTPELVKRYSSLNGVFHALSSNLLFTLRLELRLRVLTYLHLAMVDNSYAVNDTPLEPAPHIVELNSEISSFDDILSTTLSASSRTLIFSGISSLIDTVLIGLVHNLKAVNREGTGKLLRNILALQQNLKNILPTSTTGTSKQHQVSFDRCRKFYELLTAKSPKDLLNAMKRFQQSYRSTKHSQLPRPVHFAELQAILHLALGIENSGQSVGGDKLGLVQPNAGTLGLKEVSRQKLNEYLIELHEIAGEHDSDDE